MSSETSKLILKSPSIIMSSVSCDALVTLAIKSSISSDDAEGGGIRNKLSRRSYFGELLATIKIQY